MNARETCWNVLEVPVDFDSMPVHIKRCLFATFLSHAYDVEHEQLPFALRKHVSSDVAYGTVKGEVVPQHVSVGRDRHDSAPAESAASGARLHPKQYRGAAACTLKGQKVTQHVSVRRDTRISANVESAGVGIGWAAAGAAVEAEKAEGGVIYVMRVTRASLGLAMLMTNILAQPIRREIVQMIRRGVCLKKRWVPD